MRPTYKRNWIKALRSGQYPQAQESLRGDGVVLRENAFGEQELMPDPTVVGYCCLGVECEISPQKVVRIDDPQDQANQVAYIEGNARVYAMKNAKDIVVPVRWTEDGELNEHVASSSALPDEFREYLGISIAEQNTLVTMNDRGDTFDQIADWIEANL